MQTIPNYINGQWVSLQKMETLDVINPATAEVISRVPLSSAEMVQKAVSAAAAVQSEWANVPVTDRIQFLFKLKTLLENHLDELARIITMECGKTYKESLGELRRAIENVEVACGAPILLQGDFSEDIARGIDEIMIRQPVGVCGIIAPFNFPAMISFWFFPYAVAAGNTVVIKPSERVPMTMKRIFDLIAEAGFPPGVLNLVNGDRSTAEILLDHPMVRAISFVGSTPVARHIYTRSEQQGKRVQAQGGAKNPLILMPDADVEMTTRILADSAFGCAGQRCLAASVAILVGEAQEKFTDAIAEAAEVRRVGYGLDEGVQMGPVISRHSQSFIEGMIQKGLDQGANLVVDGRHALISGYENGYFIRPTVLADVAPASELIRTEIFGPVLSLIYVSSLEDAIQWVNGNPFGNMACLFTSDGSAARKFRKEAQSGNIGINIGVAAPMAFFPFSGWKDSFFGNLHGQARHAFEFFTQTKVVVERWPKDWSRQF